MSRDFRITLFDKNRTMKKQEDMDNKRALLKRIADELDTIEVGSRLVIVYWGE